MIDQNKKSERVLALSYGEAAFALIGVVQKTHQFGADHAAAFWGDVTDALCRVVMHDMKIPTHSKRTNKIARRDSIATCVLSRHYNNDYTTSQRLGCVLTAVQHTACRPDYRLMFEENKSDYFFDAAHYSAFDTHPPARIVVDAPHSPFYRFFHPDAALTLAAEKAVSHLLRDDWDEADPFAVAMYDSEINDPRKQPADLADFVAQTRAIWTDMRRQLPRVVHADLPKAS